MYNTFLFVRGFTHHAKQMFVQTLVEFLVDYCGQPHDGELSIEINHDRLRLARRKVEKRQRRYEMGEDFIG